MDFRIEAYRAAQKAKVIELSLRAWEPVFTALRPVVEEYVYDNFFPNGWATRQAYDVEQVLDHEAANVWVAVRGDDVVGWMGASFSSACICAGGSASFFGAHHGNRGSSGEHGRLAKDAGAGLDGERHPQDAAPSLRCWVFRIGRQWRAYDAGQRSRSDRALPRCRVALGS